MVRITGIDNELNVVRSGSGLDPGEGVGLPRCHIIDDGRIGDDFGERCDARALSCSPSQEVEGVSSSPDSVGYLGAGASVSAPSELTAQYPAGQGWRWDLRISGTNIGWTYLKVRDPNSVATYGSDGERVDTVCDPSLNQRSLVWLEVDREESPYAYVVSVKLPYAAYSVRRLGRGTRRDESGTGRYVRIRYWVGMMHYLSVFPNRARLGNPDSLASFSGMHAYTFYDGAFLTFDSGYVERDDEHALARARAFRFEAALTALTEVRARVTIRVFDGETIDEESLAREGFVCAFGDSVSLAVALDYVSYGSNSDSTHITRRCVTASDLRSVSSLRDLVYGSLTTSLEGFYVFHHYDVDRIVEDESDFRTGPVS